MQRALIFFGFVSLSGGCSHAPPPPVPVAGPKLAASSPSPPPLAPPTGCRAAPSTVYGDEPVVFEIEAASPTRVTVELLEAGGGRILRETVAVPGSFRPPQVPSGDFVLALGTASISCGVTVNRELSRASASHVTPGQEPLRADQAKR